MGGPFHRAKGPQDAMSRLVEWYNHERDHMSLDEGETPDMAYARKMPPRGETVMDPQSGITYRRSRACCPPLPPSRPPRGASSTKNPPQAQ